MPTVTEVLSKYPSDHQSYFLTTVVNQLFNGYTDI